MIPLCDVIPTRRTPVITLGLIALNAGVFLLGLTLTPAARGDMRFAWGLVPAEFSLLRLLTSLFIHDGWIHVISNVWALWLFGGTVEARLGHSQFLAFVILTGTLAAIAQVAAAPHSLVPILGMGGAIAGIIGAYLVLYPRSRILVMVPLFLSIDIAEIPALAFIGFWFATQLILMMGRMIDPAMGGSVTLLSYAAGFVAGLALGWLRQRRPDARLWVI